MLPSGPNSYSHNYDRPFDPSQSNAGMYEKLVTNEENDDEESIYFSTDQTKKNSTTRETYRKYLRKSNKLSAVVLPRFSEKPVVSSLSSSPTTASSQTTQGGGTATFERLETADPVRTEEEEERYERELIFDAQLWQKSNLKMKARLLGNHLKLGAQNTIKQAVEKTKKTLKKINPSGSNPAGGGSVGSRTPYPPNHDTTPNTLLDRHFAANAAIRDFNETMPVVVLPTKFEPKKGLVIRSDPASRVQEYEEAQLEEEERQRKEASKERKKKKKKKKPQVKEPVATFTITNDEEEENMADLID